MISGYSSNSNADLFRCIFSDSDVARRYQLGPDKLRYSVNFGIGPHFKNILMDNVKKSDYFVISFHKSLNPLTSEMDLLVRYLEESSKRTYTRYVVSQFLGHARHTDLFNSFCSSMKDDVMCESKLLQISMDGPSVNLKFLQDIQADRKEKGLPQLINIGTCGLHSIHGDFKTGIEKCG